MLPASEAAEDRPRNGDRRSPRTDVEVRAERSCHQTGHEDGMSAGSGAIAQNEGRQVPDVRSDPPTRNGVKRLLGFLTRKDKSEMKPLSVGHFRTFQRAYKPKFDALPDEIHGPDGVILVGDEYLKLGYENGGLAQKIAGMIDVVECMVTTSVC